MEISLHNHEPITEDTTLLAFGIDKIRNILSTMLSVCPDHTRLRVTIVDGRIQVAAWSMKGVTDNMKNAGIIEW